MATDLYGYGKSPPWPGDRDLELEDEIELLAPVLFSADKIHLIGHSYGGLIALKFALTNPDRVASLIAYEPTCFFLLVGLPGFEDASLEISAVRNETSRLVDVGNFEASAQRFVDYWVGPGAWSKTSDAVRTTVASGMRKVKFEWPNTFDRQFPAERLSALAMPTLLLTGSRSTPAARGVVQVLRSLMPRAEVIEFPDLGHMGPVTHPQVVNPTVTTFLDRVRASGAHNEPWY